MKNNFFNLPNVLQSVWRILLPMIGLLIGVNSAIASELSDNDYKVVDDLFKQDFISKTTEIVKIETFRSAEKQDTEQEKKQEKEVVKQIAVVRDKFKQWVETFNAEQKTLKFEFFEWSQKVDGKQPWLFGFRLGTGKHKVSIITHLDTVAPGNLSWNPFDARIEKRTYLGAETDFLIGRGALDDKGPAIVSLIALKALAKKFDGTDKLKDFTMELIFDTSEETDMSMPHYLEDNNTINPELGIVYDAM